MLTRRRLTGKRGSRVRKSTRACWRWRLVPWVLHVTTGLGRFSDWWMPCALPHYPGAVRGVHDLGWNVSRLLAPFPPGPPRGNGARKRMTFQTVHGSTRRVVTVKGSLHPCWSLLEFLTEKTWKSDHLLNNVIAKTDQCLYVLFVCLFVCLLFLRSASEPWGERAPTCLLEQANWRR